MFSLISPWASTFDPPSSQNVLTDFLDPTTLSHYAHTYTSAQSSFINIDVSRNLSAFIFRHLSRVCPSISLNHRPYSTPHNVIKRHHQLLNTYPLASPLDISDPDGSWWQRALPSRGLLVAYGSREILAEDCERLVRTLRNAEATRLSALRTQGSMERGTMVKEVVWDFCHAPVVVHCFLGRDHQERAEGVGKIADFIWDAVS